LLLAERIGRRHLIGLCLGLTTAVIAMVTAGFPEASAVSALLVAPLFIAIVIANWREQHTGFRRAMILMLACHLAGFMISSIQLFALFEYINYSGALDLREGYIGRSFTPEQLVPYWLSQFSIFWLSPEQRSLINFIVGMTGLCLFLTGLLVYLRRWSQRAIRWVGISLLLLMWLFVAKSFGWSSSVEWVFAHTPVLAQSHFPLYFSPLFYLGVAFFAALGAEHCIQLVSTRGSQRWWRVLWLGLLIALVLVLVIQSIETFNNISAVDVWQNYRQGNGHQNVMVFLVFAGIMFVLLMCAGRQVARRAVGPVILLALVVELSATWQTNFAGRSSDTLFRQAELTGLLNSTLQHAPLPRRELRSNDQLGNYAEFGLATIDNGISAMLPPDQRLVRRALFHTQYGGYLPLESPKRAWSYDALSSNVVVVHTPPSFTKDWRSHGVDGEISASLTYWDDSIQVTRDNPLILRGQVTGLFQDKAAPKVWVKLQSDKQTGWFEASLTSKATESKESGHKGQRRAVTIDWTISIPTYWLDSRSYSFLVRLVDPALKTFADTPQHTLTLSHQYHFDEPTLPLDALANESDMVRIASSSNNQFHAYFRPNALPRAFIAKSCSYMNSKADVQAFLAESDAVSRGVVALLANDASNSVNCASLDSTRSRVPIDYDLGSRLSLQAVEGPALLVVNDSHYPGWQAYDAISGEALQIRAANLASRAVVLPEAKRYQINFVYRPWWLSVSVILALFGLLLLGGVMYYIYRCFPVARYAESNNK
jgi:hypothetical protein